ncbi:FAD:protein FMN transferase [Idiomarina tyrosinivorans]
MKHMKVVYLRWLVLFGLAFLVSCSQQPEPIQLQGKTMGTTYHITFYHNDPSVQAKDVQQAVDAVLERVNAQMSTYDPNSELSKFNQSRSTEPKVVSRALEHVVNRALEIADETDGALDITMGPLVNLWGFGPQARPEDVPTESELAAIRPIVGYQKLTLKNHQLAKSNPDVYVDLSSIAKGYGVDRVGVLLEQMGIQHYLVEIGGEIRTRGHKPGDQPWRIAIEKPASIERAVQKIVQLENASLATSGDYRNYYEENGRRYSHIIDPATEAPIQHRLVSVSVLAEDCMSADGYATAMMVLGTEKAKQFAEQHELAIFLISKTEDGFETYASEAFKPYL